MKILYIGDIVAGPGRRLVKRVLPQLIRQHGIDLVIANAENLSGGRGVTPEKVQELIEIGVDYFTSGDHIYWGKDAEDFLEELPVLVPANYPYINPGKRDVLIEKNGKSILLFNLMGRTGFSSITSYLDDPFSTADAILTKYTEKRPDYILVDFHADSTSEKLAMGYYLDGRVTGIVGTHTHVPTCDEMRLPKGTLYVTDIGMTGVVDSVLGVKKDIILNLFKTARNQRFEWESTGRKAFRSVLLDTDSGTITRLDQVFEN